MRSIRQLSVLCRLMSTEGSSHGAAGVPHKPAKPLDKVTGLTGNCVSKETTRIVKNDGSYKVPEYFQYDKQSYFEAEVEMEKFRIPQPSSL